MVFFRSMIYTKFALLFLFSSLTLMPSPVFFVWEDDVELKKKVNSCAGDFEKKKKFHFLEKHFDLKELDRVNQELRLSATQSAKERTSQIECIINLKISEKEKLELTKSLDFYQDVLLSFLEYYNRWLYSFEKKNIMTPMDKKYTSELVLLKFDLYTLLHNKTKETLLNRDKLDKEELNALEEQITAIYLSILKGNFEYYNAITPELRKEILKKVSD